MVRRWRNLNWIWKSYVRIGSFQLIYISTAGISRDIGLLQSNKAIFRSLRFVAFILSMMERYAALVHLSKIEFDDQEVFFQCSWYFAKIKYMNQGLYTNNILQEAKYVYLWNQHIN